MNPEVENPLASPVLRDTSSSGALETGTTLESLRASTLTPDLTLAHLADPNLSVESIEQISRNPAAMNSRKVRFAVAAHSRTPRRIALKLIRELYTFDLLRFSLLPFATADLKRMADDLLVARLSSVSLGERISLARRASGKVAAALVLDRESRVWQIALENPRLTEAAIVTALLRPGTFPAFVKAVCHHPKWSVRPEIRLALLRNEYTPLARALEFAHRLTAAKLRDVLYASRLPEKIKNYLRKDLAGK